MVAVQVRQHHHINLFGPHAIGGEIVQELAPGSLRSIHGFGTEPGVN